MTRLVALAVYPVKGMRGLLLPERRVEPWGLEGDRRWMVVDPGGRFFTQRELPVLATIDVTLTDGGLVLSRGNDGVHARFPPAARPSMDVTVWRSRVPAVAADDEVESWMARVCGRACKLVYLADPTVRAVNPDHAHEGDRVSFADGYPLSLVSTASLDDLARRMGAPLGFDRFRPSLVATGFPAFAEDAWRVVRIGAVTFRVPTPIDRCVVTTLDQRTGERAVGAFSREPLRTLSTFRRRTGKVYFGVHLIPHAAGTVGVGDEVEVLERIPEREVPVYPARPRERSWLGD